MSGRIRRRRNGSISSDHDSDSEDDGGAPEILNQRDAKDRVREQLEIENEARKKEKERLSKREAHRNRHKKNVAPLPEDILNFVNDDGEGDESKNEESEEDEEEIERRRATMKRRSDANVKRIEKDGFTISVVRPEDSSSTRYKRLDVEEADETIQNTALDFLAEHFSNERLVRGTIEKINQTSSARRKMRKRRRRT